LRIRDVRESDIPQLRAIYREQGFDYQEPDWLRMFGKVLVDDQDVVQIALLQRPTVESYALVRPGNWETPGFKAEYFRRLDKASISDLKQRGYQDQSGWIPPQCRAFLRRLLKELAWVKAEGYVPVIRWFGGA
jgi:hypothetical protein